MKLASGNPGAVHQAAIKYIRDNAVPLIRRNLEYEPAHQIPIRTSLTHNQMQAMLEMEAEQQHKEQIVVVRALTNVIKEPADLDLKREQLRQRIDQDAQSPFDRWAHQCWEWMLAAVRQRKKRESEHRLLTLEKQENLEGVSVENRKTALDEAKRWSPEALQTPFAKRIAASLEAERQSRQSPPMMPPPDFGFGR